ncbi:type II toxin-antitoxin system VapC family toxin [Sphingomonas faeni]|uniref:type II toxin-antitoxin system VapC family toxin n=1 Tax=Sphingomonas faeni TaxID=185950 RepID=UPI0033559D0E
MMDRLYDPSICLIAIEIPERVLAIEVHRRYLMRVHEASLNIADRLAYAITRKDAEILFKGRDFIHTDLIDATLE